jgi:hypothetical protein
MTGVVDCPVRARCVVCNASDLQALCATAPLPVFQGCVSTERAADVAAPMKWDSCQHCRSVQLANPMPLDLIYQAGHATGLGATWDAHHAAFASFVLAHHAGEILEVGGGGGKLARLFRNLSAEPAWHILEPNPLITGAPIPGLNLVAGFLDHRTRLPSAVQTVVFCHSLEHIYDVAEMVRLLGAQVRPGGRVLIAWPDLAAWIIRGEPGALNWEHTFYTAISTLISLFERSGFALRERRPFGTEHSVFMAFERQAAYESQTLQPGPASAGEIVKGYFAEFARRAAALNRLACDVEQPIYVAPASVYAQYLFAFGLEQERVVALLDNSPLKQGKRLYGTRLSVQPLAEMGSRPSTVFLNGGAHTQEITRQLVQANPHVTVVSVAEI